ncbi:MAG: hypothetical protein ACXW1E_08410, partial [Halobacteriota archaeon]
MFRGSVRRLRVCILHLDFPKEYDSEFTRIRDEKLLKTKLALTRLPQGSQPARDRLHPRIMELRSFTVSRIGFLD